jgi:methylmalonyl-CoA mutase N-terminal domain/subunit
VRAVRSGRDSQRVEQALDDVRAAAAGTANVLPPIKSALAASATVGEVCDTLRTAWGRYEP